MPNQIRISFETVSYDTLLADADSIVANWDYAPTGHKWEVETDGIIEPYVRREYSLGASARGQGLLNFSIRLMNVTPYGYSWLKSDADKFNGQIIRRGTVFVPNSDYPISEDTGFVADGLDEQWVAVRCELELWNITRDLPRRRSLYDGARFLVLEIQCKNGIYTLPPAE